MEAIKMSKSGMNTVQIAKHFNVSQPTIGQMLLGRTWKHVSRD